MMQQKPGTGRAAAGHKKGSLRLPSCGAPGPYFLPLRWANLLRNFSTRPPSESTLFWVPV